MAVSTRGVTAAMPRTSDLSGLKYAISDIICDHGLAGAAASAAGVWGQGGGCLPLLDADAAGSGSRVQEQDAAGGAWLVVLVVSLRRGVAFRGCHLRFGQ